MLDATGKIKSDIPCETSPFDISPVGDDKAVISFPHSQSLKFLRVVPGLKFEGYINTYYKGYGVAVKENEIFLCIDDPASEKYGIHVISQNGKTIKLIKHLGDGRPKYVSVGHNGDLLFYSCPVVDDYRQSLHQRLRDAFILCITKDGHVLYRYSDKCLYNPGSLVSDDIGTLLVCDQQCCTVHIVKSSGSHIESLHFIHPRSYKLNPTSMCYNNASGVLLVAVTAKRPPPLPRPIALLERLLWTEDLSRLLLFKLQSEKRSWWERWYPGVTLQWIGAVSMVVIARFVFTRLFRDDSY